MQKTLNLIEKYSLYGLVFLFPLVIAPISPNPFVPAKLALLVYGLGFLLLLKSLRTIISGKFTWAVSLFDVPMFLLAGAYIASVFIANSNVMEALIIPGTTTGVVSGVILYFLLQQRTEKEKGILSYLLLFSGVLYALMMFAASLGVFAVFDFLPTVMRSPLFTPAGSYLPSALFLGTLTILGASLALYEKNMAMKGLIGVSTFVIILGLGMSIFNLIPGLSSNEAVTYRSPSHSVSWAVAVESLKESPLVGMGPGNFITAFSRFRSFQYNLSDNWRLKFSSASNHYLTVLTETGMVGIAAYILLLLGIYKMTIDILKKRTEKENTNIGAHISLVTLATVLFFLPASFFVTTILFIYLALATSSNKTELKLVSDHGSKLPAYLVTLPIVALVLFIFVRTTGFISAEYTFKKALDYVALNDGDKSYKTLQEAINKNPYVDRYHIRYSQINLALANAFAARVTDGQITEQQRSEITQLIQQSIREARTSVLLNPQRASSWELLARTYQTVSPLAQGADVFASQSYRQAVALDPANPNLRILWGQVHYAGGDYDTAIDIFRSATQIKPDLANAYYNLAFAYREAGDIENAKRAITTVIASVPSGSPDYEAAQKALENLESLETINIPEETETLNAPESQENLLEEPVELTDEQAPPESSLSPTPTPTETTGEQITPTTSSTPEEN